MATMQERTRCVWWLFDTKSVTQTQRNYRTHFNKQPPGDKAIRDWQSRFLETGIVHDRKRSGRPGVSDECEERIRESFVRSPTKSTRRASRELLLPRSTVHKVLHIFHSSVADVNQRKWWKVVWKIGSIRQLFVRSDIISSKLWNGIRLNLVLRSTGQVLNDVILVRTG
jgi:hypothetical protein